MKNMVYIQLDDDNIVRCIASEKCNLHKNKEHMRVYYILYGGTVGDEYNPETEQWTPRPENYPQPSEAEINERKIKQEMNKIIRDMAIKNLKEKGELPEEVV